MPRYWVLLLLFGLVLTHSVHRVRAEDDDDSAAAEEDDDDYDNESDRAHLLAHKSVSTDLVVQGRNITFTIELYNAGKSSAKEVKLADAPLPEGLSLLEGSLEGTYSTIEPSSSVKHVYVVSAVKGEKGHILEAATVNYKADSDGHQQVTRSSRPAIYVMTPFEQVTRYGLLAGRYATLGMARTPADWRNLTILIVVVAGAIGANSMYKTATTARTDRRRKQALASLEKDQ